MEFAKTLFVSFVAKNRVMYPRYRLQWKYIRVEVFWPYSLERSPRRDGAAHTHGIFHNEFEILIHAARIILNQYAYTAEKMSRVSMENGLLTIIVDIIAIVVVIVSLFDLRLNTFDNFPEFVRLFS